jgi:SAM-dependent methyltransferase
MIVHIQDNIERAPAGGAGRAVKSSIGGLLPAAFRRRLSDLLWSHGLERRPDRAYLRTVIFPALAAEKGQRVLFVGCRVYTRRYVALARRLGLDFWTTDIDPAAAPDGSPGRHVVGDIVTVGPDAFGGPFDSIVFSGVVGFGVDDRPLIEAAFANLARLLRPGGWLVVGWNCDLSADPLTIPAFARHFRRVAGPDGMTEIIFREATHRYAFARRLRPNLVTVAAPAAGLAEPAA